MVCSFGAHSNPPPTSRMRCFTSTGKWTPRPCPYSSIFLQEAQRKVVCGPFLLAHRSLRIPFTKHSNKNVSPHRRRDGRPLMTFKRLAHFASSASTWHATVGSGTTGEKYSSTASWVIWSSASHDASHDG